MGQMKHKIGQVLLMTWPPTRLTAVAAGMLLGVLRAFVKEGNMVTTAQWKQRSAQLLPWLWEQD